MNFRDLRADEIDCRVSTCNEKGVSLLLYKDARADMIILDETVGAENWQRTHEIINGNLFCNVSIKCGGEWVTKQDVGTESFTEKEKGQASDSFKRACFNWGLGRELYTAPFIWVKGSMCNMEQYNGKWTTRDRFEVADISIENKRITALSIRNSKTGSIVYTFGKTTEKKDDSAAEKPEVKCPNCGKVVTARRGKGGMTQPADILKACGGVCYDCYQAAKNGGNMFTMPAGDGK